MLQAYRLKPTEGKSITISGSSSGRQVRCSNQALPVYNDLVALANSGNYWAGMIVRGIRGLCSGRLHMDNVYIQKEQNIAYGRGIFYVVLPGVTATLEDRPDGTYELRGLSADTHYMQMQKDLQKPGLWRFEKALRNQPQFQEDGSILKKEFRSVVISDRSSSPLLEIARAAHDDLVKLDKTTSKMVSLSGFDLHHTPGDDGIVGLKPAHKALASTQDKDITQSATLLANTMFKARNIEGVLWFSDWGGSAVLTRALQILNNEKIKLPKHSVFLNRPTSKSSEALALAKEVGLSPLGDDGKYSGLRAKEILGNHLHSDITRKGAGKGAVFGLSAASAICGVVGAAPSAVGVVGLMGAMYFVSTTIQSGIDKMSGKKYK